MTVASNENQSQAQLLRHGELNWVTRGVFLGYQRNYLELQVDDLFLGDDAWDPATHTTNYDPAEASRMTPADVAQAVAWSKAHGVRIDFAFNGGGSELYKADHATTTDPLANAFADPATRSAFGWINHTYDHPNLDCSTAVLHRQGDRRQRRRGARQHGLPLDADRGGHRRALRPGQHAARQPRHDRPAELRRRRRPATGGTHPGRHLRLRDHRALGRRRDDGLASCHGVAVAAGQTVTASFNAVCHAIAYNLYRSARAPTAGRRWARSRARPRARRPTTGRPDRADDHRHRRGRARRGAAAPPTAPRSRPTPRTRTTSRGSSARASGRGHATPRRPTRRTRPTSTARSTRRARRSPRARPAALPGLPALPEQRLLQRLQAGPAARRVQLDLRRARQRRGLRARSPGVTTCRTTPATWTEYVTSENNIMFRHVMGNDPRPHFMHQSNLADYNPALPETDPNQGGILYPVIDGLLAATTRRSTAPSAPLVQLTSTQIAATLRPAVRVGGERRRGQGHGVAAGRRAARQEQRRRGHGRPADGDHGRRPLRRPEVRLDEHRRRQPSRRSRPTTRPTPRPRRCRARRRSGSTLIRDQRRLDRDAADRLRLPVAALQRRRGCVNIPGATGATYRVTAADGGAKLRVVVSAGNWVSSVSQAASRARPARVPKASAPRSEARRPARSPRALALTKVKMSPRRFAVAHKRKRRGTRLDGSRITWKLNQAATVRLTVQRRGGSAKHRRWVRVGTLKLKAKKGNGVVRFRGRFGRKLLTPRGYRLVAMANDANAEVPAQARDLQGGEGMSAEETPARRAGASGASRHARDGRRAAARRRAAGLGPRRARAPARGERAPEGRPAPARRRQPAARAGPARCRRPRPTATAPATTPRSCSFDGLVIRESLLEICREIERAMVAFEAKLDALGARRPVDRPQRREPSTSTATATA